MMNNEIRFGAPWAMVVKIVTAVTLALLLGTSIAGMTVLPETTPLAARWAMVVLPLVVLFGTLPFMVRGYVLRQGTLLIERLGWSNRVPLSGMVQASADPEALRGSIRLFGSGGLFGFFGIFRNGKLGIYRAYGTDPARSVILKLADRTLVVTPDDPGRFLAEVAAQRAIGR